MPLFAGMSCARIVEPRFSTAAQGGGGMMCGG
jgi:hypothetical protein